MYKLLFKRLFDLIVATILFSATMPIILITFILLFIQNRGKPLFYQERPGLKQSSFKIIKFKTMTDEKDENGILLPDNLRITRFGSLVRKLSIDELPQLVNVIKGEMSLVGPRPLLFKYIPLYSSEQLRRHDVRPGITGWAQVNGRNAISWQRKFELDVYYVQNISFVLDIKILWMTFLKVVHSEGVNQSKERPMNPFNGSN
jgi:undecaprenyl phosphate N,N'-diacetylbacillosamine 1-phosphate transferase